MKSKINILVRPLHVYKILAIAILGCTPILLNFLFMPKMCKKRISKVDAQIESSILDYKRILKISSF